MTEVEIAAIAEHVLGPRLDPLGLERIEVHVDRENPEEPALFVEAFIRPGAVSLGKGIAASAHHDLNRSLVDAGEARFPHLLIRYLGDESAHDGDAVGA